MSTQFENQMEEQLTPAAPLTKEELVSAMRHHRSEYEKLTSQWKKFVFQEELTKHFEEQKATLAKFKERYNFYMTQLSKDSDELKPIDWEEVEKLITTNWDGEDGYCLSHDEMGVGGLGYSYYGGGGFSGMVKDQAELNLILDLKAHAWKKKEK
jgi:hypothetical protein